MAVDGSDIQIATDPEAKDSYFPGANGQKGYNLLHLNTLYDLSHHIYTDAVIPKRMDWNEHNALPKMVDRSNIPQALVRADRGYESYNNLAHIIMKSSKKPNYYYDFTTFHGFNLPHFAFSVKFLTIFIEPKQSAKRAKTRQIVAFEEQ